ncbi:Outer membrane protein beta-barrel domain-containing protein [Dyadobacter sp. SG02]|uniref:porin family protein n=1 Tax=Dyadobacter sp. SG02 TaxID=1855291 RepID=UPI0008CBB62F|nr:porin family protein [Dyadobacter sp. SG02]SEJ59034.1 Outer membrane protein beta-barrel domain-containing protein [Dyadobacter sp. SG02]
MKRLPLLILLLAFALETTAQNGKKVSFNVRAGFSIGAAAPAGIPASIRKIESYHPGFRPSLEAKLGYRFSTHFGLATGLRFEQKGMTTEARVKAYYTTFNEEGANGTESVTGYFTGRVKTKVKNSYLTLPLHLTYHNNSAFTFKAGGFVSLLLDNNFSGDARDGYIRSETPVGEREDIDAATYDFSENVRRINAGVEIGTDYRISSGLFASANLNYALTPLMEPGFRSIDFGMHNIYLNLGIGYRFH